MKTRRIGQFGISLLIVLSFFVSSVSTCACSHHREIAESSKKSCHQEMKMEDMSGEMSGMAGDDSAGSLAKVDRGEFCNCVQPAPGTFAKSEIIKIEKHLAIRVPSIVVSSDLKEVPSPAAEETSFTKPFYLSDSLYNLKSPRAPPVL